MGITYYDTGTATLSVGSKTMTGQGTLWAGWVKPGDQVIPQEGTSGVVDAVVSNTEITLKNPYRGVAQAAQPYTIMRTPDVVFTESLARQVLQKVNDSSLVALAGLLPAARRGVRFDATANAETFPFSDKAVSLLGQNDEAAMRTFLNVAPKQSSANDGTAGAGLITGAFGLGGTDYFQPTGTNLNALDRTQILSANDSGPTNWDGALGTYPMGFHIQRSTTVQGQFAIGFNGHAGFRAKIDTASWQPWRKLFDTRNVLGTVSQSGGVPTGALMESGSNANGSYRRYADGLQTCEHSINISDVAVPNGAIYGSGSITWTQPAAYAQPPSAQGEDTSSENIWVAARGSLATTVVFKAWCFTAIASVRTIRLRSWGRWF